MRVVPSVQKEALSLSCEHLYRDCSIFKQYWVSFDITKDNIEHDRKMLQTMATAPALISESCLVISL